MKSFPSSFFLRERHQRQDEEREQSRSGEREFSWSDVRTKRIPKRGALSNRVRQFSEGLVFTTETRRARRKTKKTRRSLRLCAKSITAFDIRLKIRTIIADE
jgi:hypothetical protein